MNIIHSKYTISRLINPSTKHFLDSFHHHVRAKILGRQFFTTLFSLDCCLYNCIFKYNRQCWKPNLYCAHLQTFSFVLEHAASDLLGQPTFHPKIATKIPPNHSEWCPIVCMKLLEGVVCKPPYRECFLTNIWPILFSHSMFLVFHDRNTLSTIPSTC